MIIDIKFDRLKEILIEMESVLVAFSGGVDSTFLLKVARDLLGDRAAAITIDAPFHSRFEFNEARRLAVVIGARHIVLDLHDLQVDGLDDNPPDRCYLCKKAVFSLCREQARDSGFRFLVDGSNADDLQDYRPGRRALAELEVRSPLLEAGLEKGEIRQLSRRLGLDTWDKPALACLLTRFPHGERVTVEGFAMVERCEDFLRSRGYGLFRVRSHGEGARIELAPEELGRLLETGERTAVTEFFHAAGFRYVALDLDGYRCGAMNEITTG